MKSTKGISKTGISSASGDSSNVVIAKSLRGSFYVDTKRDGKMLGSLCEGTHHQLDSILLLEHFMDKDSVVIDAGAHIGTMTIPLARFVKQVIAFEPSPITFDFLKKNIALNGLWNIDARNKGLGSRSGSMSLEPLSGVNAGAQMLDNKPGSIQIAALDDEVEKADLIKIDVEGMEPDAFKGAERLISSCKPVIFSEVNPRALKAHGSGVSAVQSFLSSHGYRLYFPLQSGGKMALGKMPSLWLVSLILNPGRLVRKSAGAPFDVLAIPDGRVIPEGIEAVSVGKTLSHLFSINMKDKARRIRELFRPRHIIYFTNGSIGDFLLALYFSDLTSSASPEMRILVSTPRNASLFRELAVEYPIKIIECNSRTASGITNCFRLILHSVRPNMVVMPLPLRSVPLTTRIFARSLALMPRSVFSAFDQYDGPDFYPYMMASLAESLGFAVGKSALKTYDETPPYLEECIAPRLRFKRDQAILDKSGLIKGEYIIIHPCGSSAVRTLSTDEIISIVQLIHQKEPSLKVIFTGSPKDRAHIEGAVSRLSGIDADYDNSQAYSGTSIGDIHQSSRVDQSPDLIVNLAGKLSMNELANVIEGSRLYIGVDTGISHVAAMIGVKSLIIGHSGSLLQWLPYYNHNAKIVYNVKDCSHGIHEGFEHLKECYDEEDKYLLHTPIDAVLELLTGMLTK